MRRLTVILVASAAIAGLGACGGDDDDASAADIERYCELSAKLEEADTRPADSGAEQQDAAQAQAAVVADMKHYMDENQALIDDLTAAAPEEIHSEMVEAFAIFRRVAEGDIGALEDLAADKLDKFNEEHCT